MRLHLVALPHTQTTAAFASCAYTQKVVKFCRMMTERGHEVVLYGPEVNEAPCAEHVTLIYESERRDWFGEAFDTVLAHGFSWDASKPYWHTLNGRAIGALSSRVNPTEDLVLLSTGSQELVKQALAPNDASPAVICCEWTVGYEGIVTPFCAFESSSFMHTVYAQKGIANGRDLDAVIPNFFDLDEFPHVNQGDGDYLLFIGRLVSRKGVLVAAEIAERVGLPLKIAGPGALSWENDELVTSEFVLKGDHIEYVGEVGITERAELMAGARAVLAPTSYFEPFGGVAVEAQLCGTPVLTTDHGAFRETVPECWRFRSLAEALRALDNPYMHTGGPELVRLDAVRKFGFDAVAPQYERWFDRLLDLWGQGWYELPAEMRERIPA